MRAHLDWRDVICPGQFRRLAAGLSVGLIALLIATTLSTAAAGAQTGEHAATLHASASKVQAALVEVPTGSLTPILSGLPASNLGLTNAQLGTLLSGLGEGVLSGQGAALTGVVSTLLSGNPSATLGELSGAVLANPVLGALLAGKSLTPEQIVAGLTPQQLSTFLGNITSGLSSAQITQILSGLAKGLSSEQLTALHSTLNTILAALAEGLSAEQLGQLRSDLHALPTGLGEGELNLLHPAQLAGVVSGLFGTATPSQLSPVVGDLLKGLSWSAGTAGSLAEGLGVPVETLATALGESTGSGFAGLPALTSKVGSTGQVMTLVNRARGLAAGLVGPEGKGGGEGSGGGTGGSGSGSGGSGGAAGNGGSGNSGAGGSGGSALRGEGLTVVITLPGPPAAMPRTLRRNALKKIRILSHRVRGRVATIVLLAPSAGRLTLSGHGIRTATARLRWGGRVTITATLSRGRMASLRRTHHHLRVRLRVTFKPTAGASSAAATAVTFA